MPKKLPARTLQAKLPPNEVRIIDPKTGGQKGSKLERYDLLPMAAMDEVARVYGLGAMKYEDNNWLKGYKWGLSIAALQRHVSKFMSGESLDPDDELVMPGKRLHHLAHVVWHCMTLMMYEKLGRGTDDRMHTKLLEGLPKELSYILTAPRQTPKTKTSAPRRPRSAPRRKPAKR